MRRFEHHIHEPPKHWFWRYIWSHDHKVIGIQFLLFSLFWLFIGGFLAMVIRWQLAFPGKAFPILGTILFNADTGIMDPAQYNMAVTMHGTIMVLVALPGLLSGCFGNYLIPLQIGARDMAFPFLNALSFWTTTTGSMILLYSFFVEGGAAQSGWTAYPPLSTVGSLGDGQTLWLAGLFVAGCGTIMGAVNYITTIVLFRAPGMDMMKLPMTQWGLFLTAVLNALYVPVIASGFLMLLMDRVMHTSFFTAGVLAASSSYAPGGQVLLYQHVFWVFGHPEVYILILPAWGMVSDFLAFFARKPAFGYRETVYSMIAICVLSTVVWGHHMFVSGMNPYLGRVFSMATFMVSIPSAIFFLNWLGTLYKGSIRFTVPMLFSLSVVFVFGLGGLTGLFNGSQGLDIYLHDTYFVVGHFHFTMAASVFLGGIAAVYFWFPKMFGRKMNHWLGVIHFLCSVVFITAVFGGMLQVGAAGHMRRVANPEVYKFLAPLLQTNKMISMAAFSIFASQIVFVFNLVYSYFNGERAGSNPWECTTLEWSIPSPPPAHNFDVTPTVYNGPFEFSNPRVKDADFLLQDQPLPEEEDA